MVEEIFICDKCNHRVKKGANFCPNCGGKLNWGINSKGSSKKKLDRVSPASNKCPECGCRSGKHIPLCSRYNKEASAENKGTHSKKDKIDVDPKAVSAIDSESLSEICEYINGIVSVFLILFTPLLFAILILCDINKLKQGLSDEEAIVRLKTVRRCCTWIIVLSIIQFPVFVLIFPIIAFHFVFEIRRMADSIIKKYESKHLD